MSTDNLVTAAEAAALAGVSLQTIRNWKKHGRLHERAVARGERGQFILLYDPHDVLKVERATRLADPTQRRARQSRNA